MLIPLEILLYSSKRLRNVGQESRKEIVGHQECSWGGGSLQSSQREASVTGEASFRKGSSQPVLDLLPACTEETCHI